MTDPIAPQILIVDDARDIREPLGQYLRKQGFRTRLAAHAGEARDVLAEATIHLVVLDIMMPGEDGLSLCRWLVAQGGPPVLLLTAMADETDRIVGLELGADDYLVKPFNPRELLARVRAILRRMPPEIAAPPSARRAFADWVHDPDARQLVNVQGHTVSLTSAENRLLGIFLDHPRSVLSRAVLLDLTAGREAKAYDRAIDNQISRLRRKIEADPGNPQILVTEWGGGYRLVADVTPAPTGAGSA
ncbi:response regulator [Roseovarius nanhaiticus]|uniref:Two-component system, OmpR family, response regulator n=1 Tax=Roseovarius nanhaiticus TaxID=573024 RepID=A0A1N7HM57_9RHOB|nr:response regulator [Roseovarius nanhaiticus]SEL28629.1 two-component system, OmpR family, response regulator [Roseovarius nanhaiticus]SIS25760.1 two-component system, OmpR family, response regulator [Roseovarius nanhaiticus]